MFREVRIRGSRFSGYGSVPLVVGPLYSWAGTSLLRKPDWEVRSIFWSARKAFVFLKSGWRQQSGDAGTALVPALLPQDGLNIGSRRPTFIDD